MHNINRYNIKHKYVHGGEHKNVEILFVIDVKLLSA